MQAGKADAGIGLVDGAYSLEANVRLRSPLAGDEARRAVVAGARVDLVELDHVAPRPCDQPPLRRVKYSASRIKTRATNCSATRACISLFEVVLEPPRIMLMSPRISTMTTATMTRMAMMLKTVD